MLWKGSVDTEVAVPGRCLEAQYCSNPLTLLFLTHDVPYEEQLEIVLIRDDRVVLDHVSIGGGLTTGNFRDAAIEPPDVVSFSFFGGHRWYARVLPRPRLRLPIATCAGVHRPWGWRCWIDVGAMR